MQNKYLLLTDQITVFVPLNDYFLQILTFDISVAFHKIAKFCTHKQRGIGTCQQFINTNSRVQIYSQNAIEAQSAEKFTCKE